MNSQNNIEKVKNNGKRKMKKWKKALLIILCVIIVFDICLVTVFLALYYNGKKAAKPDVSPTIIPPSEVEGVQSEDDGKTVIYLGEKYKYNENMTTCLIMGTDNGDRDGEIGSNGEADTIILVAFDASSGRVSALNISRDSMVNINIYSTDGAFVRKEKTQICLAYDYGDGAQTSCKNVADAVSDLLCGVPVVKYISIDIAAMSVLADEVNGVEVPEYDETYTNKTGDVITVFGEDARKYLQSRDISYIASNNTRMDRQTDFLRSFVSKAITETKGDIGVPAGLFKSVGDYMITDVDASLVTYYATNFLTKNGTVDYMTVPGTVSEGEDGYAEYHIDKQKMYEMILSVFYLKEE